MGEGESQNYMKGVLSVPLNCRLSSVGRAVMIKGSSPLVGFRKDNRGMGSARSTLSITAL